MTSRFIRTIFLASLFVVASISITAYAEGDNPATEQDTPITRYAAEAEDLLRNLSEEQAKKYHLIRDTHGIIRSVQSVETIVGKAVKECKEKHGELGENIDKRFTEWKLAVHPVVKSGEDRLEKLILLQDYAKPSDVKKHLKSFDAAAQYGEKLIDLKTASDKKSCTALLKDMDKTQPNLIRLLRENIGLDK